MLNEVRIPNEIAHLFKKACAIKGYTYVKVRQTESDPILMSGIPMHEALETLEELETGEVAPVDITVVSQLHTDRYGNRLVMETVNCPRCGKIVSVRKACGGRKRSRQGADHLSPCLYFVSSKQGKIVCLHPRAEEFSRRSPWKEPEDRSDLPLFDGVEIPSGCKDANGVCGTQ